MSINVSWKFPWNKSGAHFKFHTPGATENNKWSLFLGKTGKIRWNSLFTSYIRALDLILLRIRKSYRDKRPAVFFAKCSSRISSVSNRLLILILHIFRSPWQYCKQFCCLKLGFLTYFSWNRIFNNIQSCGREDMWQKVYLFAISCLSNCITCTKSHFFVYLGSASR